MVGPWSPSWQSTAWEDPNWVAFAVRNAHPSTGGPPANQVVASRVAACRVTEHAVTPASAKGVPPDGRGAGRRDTEMDSTVSDETLQPPAGTRLDGRWVATGVALAALAVYWKTLAPGLTFEHYGTDGGDLIAAAHTLGIPHPSGYPTFTLLAWLFTHLPVGTIAFRTNLLSAVCASSAVGVVCRVVQILLPPDRRTLVLSAASALSLAFSSLLWSQSVITEVYALLTLFAALLLWLLVRWRQGGGDRILWVAALLLGLGLGNHLTFAAAIPSTLVLLWPYRRRWLRFQSLASAARFFAAGLCIYLYLPIAAIHHPPMNWGYPRTWDRFLWEVTASQYRIFAFGLAPEMIGSRLSAWSRLLGQQFGWWGLAIALAGFWQCIRRDRALALFTVTWTALIASYAFFYDVSDSHVFLLPAFLLMGICWGLGAHYLVTVVRRFRPRLANLALAAIAALPLVSAARNWKDADLSHDWSAHVYAQRILDEADSNGLLIVRGDRPTFAAWYAAYAERRRADVAVVNGPLLAYIWYREHLRGLYPDLVLTEPRAGDDTSDDLIRNLITANIGLRPVYSTDPRESWYEWFDFAEDETGVLYQIQIKTTRDPAG